MSDRDAANKSSEKSEKTPKALVWRAWGWWQWVSRARWLNWLVSLFTTKAGVALGLVGAATVGAGAMVITAPEVVRDIVVPRVTVATEKWTDNTIVFPITGIDKAGFSASFDVAVLTRGTTWARGSTDRLEQGADSIGARDIRAKVLTPEVLAGLGRSDDWIAVGVASQEGAAEVEGLRAQRRAKSAAEWIKAASDASSRRPRKIWRLDLGQYKSGCEATAASKDTSFQRPFMMIGVRKQDPGVVLSEALADAMSGKANLPSPDCYSRFNLDQG